MLQKRSADEAVLKLALAAVFKDSLMFRGFVSPHDKKKR